MELRKISKESVASALDKAKHYRLLNDPENAESICRDVLDIDPHNQIAISHLVLALTDQFDGGSARVAEAKDWTAKLKSEYERLYLQGLISERAAKRIIATHRPESHYDAYDLFKEAMQYFDLADRLASDDSNDDPILRWNSCARLIQRYHLTPRSNEAFRPYGD
jgi:hypothetical protein